MKKKLLYLLMLFGLTSIVDVSAKEILSDDIPPRTYVIGTYEFTDSTTLSTKHIMLASKTIEGDTLDDMIIYYKNPRGQWLNGLTGETVLVNEKFDIEYVDTVKYLTAPTLENDYNDKTKASLSILGAGYYGSSEETLKEISGWELYEKTEGGYTKITEGTNYTYELALIPGETKTFVARVYKLTSTLDKVYSDYSNEVTITRDKLNIPTLENDFGDEAKANLSILGAGYYGSSEETLKEISGWELYEKTESGYALLYSGANYNYEMTLNFSGSKTLVARVYVEIEDGAKIYSDYSDELVLMGNTLETPTLIHDPSDLSGAHLSMLVEGYYASGSDALKEISGWELYEKTENGYALLHDGTSYTFNVSMEQGTTKTFVSRVYLNKEDGTKIYSEYSNEVVVTIEKIKVPTLTANKNNDKMTLSIINEGTYKDETEQNKITGWKLYEKGETDKLLASDKPYTYEMDIPYGETKTYYARIYIIDVYENKVYSENSAELVIDEKLPTPTLSNDYSYTDGAKLSILSEGYYGESSEKKDIISGWELYEKTESGYSLITDGTNYTYELEMESGSSKAFLSRVYKNINGEKVYSDYSNEITIERILIGDANCDGEISGLDSSVISRYVDNLSVDKISLKNADVNLDGEVNEVDSAIILYYIAHKDSEDAITLPYDAGEVYKITYDLDGGVLNDGSHNPGSYAEISLPFSLSIPTKDGYEFIGWTGSNGYTPELEVRIPKGTTGNLNYKANWNLK